MGIRHKPRRGEIFWLENCPPLDGHEAKHRPVIFLGAIKLADPKSPFSGCGRFPHCEHAGS